jgi:patatin-like phospholipase/acyl hydrolase
VLKPCAVFDLIVGTSTGGIIATMLRRLEMSIKDALKQYEVVGERVFGKKPFGSPLGKLARGLTSRLFFEIKDLQKAIKDLLKDKKIDEGTTLYIEKNPSCKM